MAAVVLDTNVVVYHLLGVEEHRPLLSKLFRSDMEFIAPENLKAEILNVLWLAVRNNAITFGEALTKLDSAEHLITRSIPIAHVWGSALALATASNHSPYDTLFIAAAEREGLKLLTFDRKLRHAFPATAIDPRHYQP